MTSPHTVNQLVAPPPFNPVTTKPSFHSFLDLNGQWKLEGWSSENQQHYTLNTPVPGHVHSALQSAGYLPDLFWRNNADDCQWVERYHWKFSRTFEIPEELHSVWAEITFEGLDTYCVVSLNGKELARTDNMFVPHRFNVTQQLVLGTNTLELEFLPQHEVLDGVEFSFPAAFSADRVYTRRMQCSYGWDWAHRFVGAAVWQPVRLDFYQEARLSDIFVATQTVQDNQAELQVEVEVDPLETNNLQLDLLVTDPDGTIVATMERSVHGGLNHYRIDIKDPQLWYPNGYGDPSLYTLSATLRNQYGQSLDCRHVDFGIRTVVVEQEPDDIGSGFRFVINGIPVFAKGGNWIPASPFPGSIPEEHYGRLIQQAQLANMNMMRAWGGGIYEPEVFWNACDRAGIMITQDFLLACANYPEDDPTFQKQLRHEFATAIRLLRNHPSLVCYFGNNELGMGDDPETDFPGKKTSIEITGPLCQELDPTRPFFITSPFGGNPNNSEKAGDTHRSVWFEVDFVRSEMADYRERIHALTGRFLSESTTAGTPPMRDLLRFLDPDDLLDPGDALLDYHTKDNPYNGIDELNHYGIIRKTARCLFGEPATTARRFAQEEYLQYEFVRLISESLRRQKPHCNGLLFWMYNDYWPAIGWSLIDYYGTRKASWYAAQHSFKPVIINGVVNNGKLEVFVCNDTAVEGQGRVKLAFQPWSGTPIWQQEQEVAIAADSSAMVYSCDTKELPGKTGVDGILVAELSSSVGCDRNLIADGMPKDMNLPIAHVEIGPVSRSAESRCCEISFTVRTDNYARVVTLVGGFDFSDNYFDLLPGERRTITATPIMTDKHDLLTVQWWNGPTEGLSEVGLQI